MTYSNIAVFAATGAAVFSAFLSMFIIYYARYRRARYDSEIQRAQLEMLREAQERRIYELTDRLASTEERWKDLNHLLVSRLNTQADFSDSRGSITPTRFLRLYGIGEDECQVDPQLVFVLTPFNKEFRSTFDAIAEACRDVGLRCLRGDEEQVSGDLMPHILRLIVKARIIVANIDGRNPNVFYELGVAHALDKVTILVTSSIDTVPFDLKSKKLIAYKELRDLKFSLNRELARSAISTQPDS